MIITLPLKPISTNKIWSGKRWLSPSAKQFQRDCTRLLQVQRKRLRSKEGDMSIHFRFGLSRDMDTSNCIKLLEDCIASVMGIDDMRFRGITATKEKVSKGAEFISFDITDYVDEHFLPNKNAE